MAQIAVQIPDAFAQDVLDAFKWKYNRRETAMNQGEGDVAYAKRMLALEVQDMYIKYKKASAGQAAEDAAATQAANVIIS